MESFERRARQASERARASSHSESEAQEGTDSESEGEDVEDESEGVSERSESEGDSVNQSTNDSVSEGDCVEGESVSQVVGKKIFSVVGGSGTSVRQSPPAASNEIDKMPAVPESDRQASRAEAGGSWWQGKGKGKGVSKGFKGKKGY